MLEAPENKSQDSNHLIGPLMVQSHKYPPKVANKIATDHNEITRGIGAYQELNWYFKGKNLTIWLSDKTYET